MDLLRLPAFHSLAHHRRRALQWSLLILAAVLVLHGLLGPDLAPRNLATVITWVHYRGLLILALLALGNLFCTGCPMILVRDAGRRLGHPALRWPRALRNKWPAVVLFAGVLFTYELFDLWSLPRATALLILGYFAAALLVDVVFAGASFCKYLCPIGQFNFLASTLSPAELRVRDPHVCRSCRTVDCIRGRRELPASAAAPATLRSAGPPGVVQVTNGQAVSHLRVVQRGCELGLFLPAKVGNLDCTLCFDCVRACPHDNIGLLSRVPGEELASAARRSGIGRLPARLDLAALAVVFTFGALVNAFAMTAPAGAAQNWIVSAFGLRSEAAALAVIFLVSLAFVPLALLMGAAGLTRALTRRIRLQPDRTADVRSLRDLALRYVYALLPFGVAVWTAHYGYHALTGIWTAIPVAQSAAIDLADRAILGEPLWTWTGAAPGAVYPLQLGVILLGTAGSVAVAHRIAAQLHPAAPVRGLLPWAALLVMLGATAAWVLSQPMDMRGVGLAG